MAESDKFVEMTLYGVGMYTYLGTRTAYIQYNREADIHCETNPRL